MEEIQRPQETNCSYCLEQITNNTTEHRFDYGCHLKLHEDCKMTLVEMGMLRNCWYCQRSTLNSRTPLIQTILPPQRPNCLYFILVGWHAILLVFISGFIIYNKIKNMINNDNNDRNAYYNQNIDAIILTCIFLATTTISMIFGSVKLCISNRLSGLGPRMVVNFVGIIEMIILLSFKEYELALVCGFGNITTQLYIGSL